MADYGAGAISLSQAREISHTSDSSSSDRSPRSVRTLSGGGGRRGSTTSPRSRKSTGDLSSPSELPRKPRGRPPGSKNKPKPPVFITKDSDAMKPVVLEISAGSDVVEEIIKYARKRRVGLIVLSGTGSVSTVTLRHPMPHAPAFPLRGPFSMVSLSGSFVGCSATSSPTSKPSSSSSSSSSWPSSFGICLAGAQGQVFGGIVGGQVVAASLVLVVASTFINPTVHRLPAEQEHEGAEENKASMAGPGAGVVPGNEGSSGSMSVYSTVASPTPISCQLSPDVMPWGPNSRSPY